MKPNPSQYSGTLKNTICTKCQKSINHLTPIQQERHAKVCSKQTTLFGGN